MGLGRRRESSPEVRQWLGNLLVAWTFVTGLFAAFASAWYGRTGDIKILIAYLGAPFLIGVVLFVGLGAYALATSTSRPIAEDGPSGQRRKRRAGMFHRAPPAPHVENHTLGVLGFDPRDPQAWERVSLRGRPGEEDLTEFNRVRLESSHARVATGVLALAAGVGWAQVFAPAILQIDAFDAAPLALLGGGTVLLAILLRRPRALAKRAVRRETHMETTYRLGPEGLEVMDARGRGRYGWQDIAHVKEGTGIFLVRIIDGQQVMIPKRAAGPETLGRMRAVMRVHAGERAALRVA